jgi:uncharacterized protein (TIGR02246 family)
MMMSDDEQAIRKVIETWMRATASGDLATVLTLMSDDVVFLVAGQKPFGKPQFEETSRRMEAVQIDGNGEVQEIEVAGSWAWCRSQLNVVMRPAGGVPFRRSGPTLTVFRKQPDGRWVIARDANLLTAG